MNSISVGFCGSGKFAASCLDIISKRVRSEWVITNIPRLSGRGMKLQNTPVFDTAQQLGLTCFTTEKLSRDEALIERIKSNTPDVILVIDFGQMIKEPVLSLPKFGCVNIHPSRLPQYRGSAPLQRAVMDGLNSTAVSIFRLDVGMDSGDIMAQPELEISPDDTYEMLLERAAEVGSDALLHFLCDVPCEEWIFTKQDDSKATFAPKIEKSEAKICWERETPEHICNKIRAIGHSFGVYTMFRGKRLRITKAAPCGRALTPGAIAADKGTLIVGAQGGALAVTEVQPEGKKPIAVSNWICGARITAADKFDL